jgi:hypothetical protein
MQAGAGGARLRAMASLDPTTVLLAVTVAGLLMLLSGIAKKQLEWRPGAPRRRPRARPRFRRHAH